MKKIKLKRRIMLKKQTIIIIVLVFMIVMVFETISFINKKITPIIIEITEPEINKLSIDIVNNAVNRVLDDDLKKVDFFTTVLSEDGRIQTIDFNSMVINKVLNITTTAAQNDLRLLEKGKLENIGIKNIEISQNKIEKVKRGIIAEVPIGMIFKNSLLANIGPKIPIRLHYVGNVNSNIVTKISQYGINNALMEVGINLEITAQLLLPLTSKKMVMNCYIPIAIKVIQGIVPNYYSSGIENQSQMYSIPF